MHATARHSPGRPAGFTLIELLTVIAIIGILAAILIPTIGRIRQSAFASRSTSNLRQLAMGANLYANENKGYYPPVNALNKLGQVDYAKPWSNDVNFTRYLNVIKPDWLPGSSSIVQSGFPASPWAGQPGRATIGYNCTDVYDYSAPNYLRTMQAIKIADVRAPAQLLMFAEAVDYKIQYSGRTGWTPEMDEGGASGLTDKIAYRINGGKTLFSTYSGAVKKLSMAEVDSRPLWSNFRPDAP